MPRVSFKGPDLQVTARYNAKGALGSGDWYGVCGYAGYLTVCYDKASFTRSGRLLP